MRDVIADAVDELDWVAAGGHDVAEVHHDPHPATGEAVTELLSPPEVPAQPEVVQRLGPHLDAAVVGGLRCGDELRSDQVVAGIQGPHRGVIQRPAGQHQCG